MDAPYDVALKYGTTKPRMQPENLSRGDNLGTAQERQCFVAVFLRLPNRIRMIGLSLVLQAIRKLAMAASGRGPSGLML